MNEYRITAHLRERYVERKNKRYRHLSECGGCPHCNVLIFEIRDKIRKERAQIDAEINELIKGGSEDRSYLNNSEFMARYHEKYGYDHRVKFVVNGEFVFVCVEKDGDKAILTCLYSNRHISIKHTKFKKKTA